MTYWRDGNREVDFVVEKGRQKLVIQVGSGDGKGTLPGFDAFERAFGSAKRLLVARQGIPLDQFLRTPFSHWLNEPSGSGRTSG